MSVDNALDRALRATKAEGRAALIPYLTAGYPDPDRFVDLAVAVLEAGADALEIGVPFSDPLLDGPAIQRSQQAALDRGITPARCLAFAGEIHARSRKPLLCMGAYNPMLAYGFGRFCADAAGAGITALITPDLPIEEQEDLREDAITANLHLIEFVAPTSTQARVERTCRTASGFIYGISVAGVTGARASVVETARPLVERVKACTDVPVAVGFGIAGPDQAREVAAFADGVIVGSALINLVGTAEDPIAAAHTFIQSLRQALIPTPA